MPTLLRAFNLSFQGLKGNLLKIPYTSSRLPCVRSVSIIPLKRHMKEEQFAEKDKVPDGYKMIYRAPMENYVKVSKLVSTGTAAFIGGLAFFKFATDNKYIQLAQELDLGGLVAHDSDIYFFAVGFLAINGAIMTFLTKYPLRMYKNEKKYLAIYEALLPFKVNRYHFNQGEVQELKHLFNPWSLITYRIGSKVTLLLLDYFKTPSEFHDMCAGNIENKN